MVDSDFKEKIEELWRDPKFPGSFSGLENFRNSLKYEKNIIVSRKALYNILSKDRNYILEMRKVKKRFKRRAMNIHGFGILWQADLGQLFEYNNFVFFLLCIDVFSRRIFCRPLKSKRPKEVQEAFKAIFVEANIRPEKLETDAGVEFVNNKQFFEREKIFLKIKIGANKARYVYILFFLRHISKISFFL